MAASKALQGLKTALPLALALVFSQAGSSTAGPIYSTLEGENHRGGNSLAEYLMAFKAVCAMDDLHRIKPDFSRTEAKLFIPILLTPTEKTKRIESFVVRQFLDTSSPSGTDNLTSPNGKFSDTLRERLRRIFRDNDGEAIFTPAEIEELIQNELSANFNPATLILFSIHDTKKRDKLEGPPPQLPVTDYQLFRG